MKRIVEQLMEQLKVSGAFVCLVVAMFILLGNAPVQARPLDPIAPEEVARQVQELTPRVFDGFVTEKDDGWIESCRRSVFSLHVTDPVTGMVRTQEFTLVRPTSTLAPAPVMIVVPSMEGITPIESSIASQFCQSQVATIIADVNDNTVPSVIPSWGIEDIRIRYAILALRTLIEFAQGSSYFDSKRIGFIGNSLGAVVGSYLAGLEPSRLAASILVLPGGNIPYILSVSDNSRVKSMRDKRMAAEGYTAVEQYENKLRETVRFDPLHYASTANTENMLFVMSTNDKTVPSAMQNELYNSFGKPLVSYYKLGHVQSIVAFTYWYFNTATDFLSKKFGIKMRAIRPTKQTPVFLQPTTSFQLVN